MKNSSETSSANVEPIAAPAIPKAGIPNLPKIRIQLNRTLDISITTELMPKALVCVVPI